MWKLSHSWGCPLLAGRKAWPGNVSLVGAVPRAQAGAPPSSPSPWGTASACQPLALGSTETFSVYCKQISISVMNVPWHGAATISYFSQLRPFHWVETLPEAGVPPYPVVLGVSHSAGWKARVQPLRAGSVSCTPWWWWSPGLRTRARPFSLALGEYVFSHRTVSAFVCFT